MNETKYITENMGEVTIKNNKFVYIYGKYDSEDIQIANLGLVSSKFKENFEYIMNIINQYSKIHEISKIAIIKNFNINENIKRFFNPYNSLREEELIELIKKYYNGNILNMLEHFDTLEMLFDFLDIKIFDGFDINMAVDKLKYPRLYFANNFSGCYGNEEIYFEVQYRMPDKIDLVFKVFMDSKFNIYDFDCCRPLIIDMK